MKFSKHLFYVATCGVATLALAVSANAQYSGIGWEVSSAVAGSATLANATAQSGNGNNVTFNASGLNFSSFANPAADSGTNNANYTVSTFLNSQGSASALAYHGAVASGTALDNGGGGFLFQFTGSAFFTNGQTFTVNHDDGVDLFVGGTEVLNNSGPTAPHTNTYTYTGATGNQSFDFIYGECCGAPAVFQTTLVPATATPEPASIALMASMLLGVGGIAYRRRRNAA
jgi:hypothetical protein